MVDMVTPLRGQTQPAGRIYLLNSPCPCRSTCCQTPEPPQSHDKTTAIAQTLKTSPSTPIA